MRIFHLLLLSKKSSKTFSMKADLETNNLTESKSDSIPLSSEIETPFFVNNIIYGKVIILHITPNLVEK